MNILPSALVDTIDALNGLPGVGQRSAERFAYHLLKSDPVKSDKIANALLELHKKVKYCPVTFALIDEADLVSPLYEDSKRDKSTVAVVEDAFDIVAIERTGLFRGTYHVLGGLISPIDGVGPEILHIPELIKRIKKDSVKEIILAISSSVEGESTAHFIQNQLNSTDCKVTRLARGLPVGLDIEYADHLTLSRAFEGRQLL